MLTVQQAALLAGVSDSLIRIWIADGTLPHYRLGARGKRGKIAIASDDLDAVLKSCKVGTCVRCQSTQSVKPNRPIKLKHLQMPS